MTGCLTTEDKKLIAILNSLLFTSPDSSVTIVPYSQGDKRGYSFQVNPLAPTLNVGGTTTDSSTQKETTEVTNVDGRTQHTIPLGYLLKYIIIIPISLCHPYMGFVGGDPGELIGINYTIDITPNNCAVWNVGILSYPVAKSIIIEGVPEGSTIIFLREKISL